MFPMECLLTLKFWANLFHEVTECCYLPSIHRFKNMHGGNRCMCVLFFYLVLVKNASSVPESYHGIMTHFGFSLTEQDNSHLL